MSPKMFIVEFFHELTVPFRIPNKRSYQLTVLFNSAYFSMWLRLSELQYFVGLFIILLMLW